MCREFFRKIFTTNVCAEAAFKFILEYFMHRKDGKCKYVLSIEQYILINFSCALWENNHLENQQERAKAKILVLANKSLVHSDSQYIHLMPIKLIFFNTYLLQTMLVKFRIGLLGKVNSSFPSHVYKEVAHREVACMEGGWWGAPFVHGCGDLPASCRIVTGYRLGLHVFPYL